MPSCDALVFMVDSNDVDRLPEAREELQVCFAWCTTYGLSAVSGVALLCAARPINPCLRTAVISARFAVTAAVPERVIISISGPLRVLSSVS